MDNFGYLKSIKKASKVVGRTWPLYSFVTSNPLSGYEQANFAKAINSAENLIGGNVFPSARNFKKACYNGEIDKEILTSLLIKQGFTDSIKSYLDRLQAIHPISQINVHHKLDHIVAKWLATFMDEGLAEWEMPHKEKGFYQSWRGLAIYDNEIGIAKIDDLPTNREAALSHIMAGFTEAETESIFEYHLAALPGWTGYIKLREENNTIWQQTYPISLLDYLAVRFCIAQAINIPLIPLKTTDSRECEVKDLQYLFLKAWEQTWQTSLLRKLKLNGITTNSREKTKTDAQLVFCIDTRSELIRRHVEASGNYETFGYAGFFGIAMDYTNLEDGLSRKSCPPIVGSAYQVSELSQENKTGELTVFHKRAKRDSFKNYFLTRMKNMLPSAFGYVEGAGVFYGFSLLSRTLFPAKDYNPERNNELAYEHSCSPKLNTISPASDFQDDIPLEEKVGIVKSAFDLTGWNEFAPLVVFAGHGSHTSNNPFGSSLDCGACAASPGRHNARMLAKLANLPEVRKVLNDQHGLSITPDTIFMGAEHNTTTDEIVLFDSQIPASHGAHLQSLKANLKRAQESAARERIGVASNGINAAHKKANNWAETRPEWGLAKNAGFIVAPRSLTQDVNLEGNCFLHSYNWELDAEGKALEGIMQGPMVVTQWINNHYYFATVDNEQYGGGSKITHNVTGRHGVVRGNGGDLKIGLPLQSVNATDDDLYHKPLRLSVLIQAPEERIQDILERNDNLKSLLDNEWIYLLIMDPTQDNAIIHYKKDMKWNRPNFKANTDKVSYISSV